MEQMIGNAVPVKLAEYVANALKEYIDDSVLDLPLLNKDGFTSWLVSDKEYTKRSAGDVFSRLRRADSICALKEPDSRYLFELEHTNVFASLSPSVRSQIKKAVHLYEEYIESY
jgi:DNA (cytosine-5)-methyltransferase 1